MSEGISDARLPWLLRLLFNLALDGLEQEINAIRESDIPTVDAFIGYDPIISFIYIEKKIESIAEYLLTGDADVYKSEYEIAYLKNRLALRARLKKRDPSELIYDINKKR